MIILGTLVQRKRYSKTVWITKMIWTGLSIAVLTYVLYLYNKTHSPEIEIIQFYYMSVLSFPASVLLILLSWAVLLLLDEYFSIVVPSGYPGIVLTWLGFFVVGYLQWFRLVPFVFRKLKERKNKMRQQQLEQ